MWTDDIITFAKQHWPDHSARQIAQMIHARFGVTFSRNAVVGKMFREGMPPKSPDTIRAMASLRHGPAKVKAKQEPHRTRKPKRIRKPKAVKIARPDSRRITILARQRGDCAYPTHTLPDGDHRFCGHPVKTGSYCAYHAAVCYNISETEKARNRALSTDAKQAKAGKPGWWT